MADQEEQKVEKLDEPDVEAHRLDKTESRHDMGRAELGETEEEPDVEAHRFDKFEGRHDKVD